MNHTFNRKTGVIGPCHPAAHLMGRPKPGVRKAKGAKAHGATSPASRLVVTPAQTPRPVQPKAAKSRSAAKRQAKSDTRQPARHISFAHLFSPDAYRGSLDVVTDPAATAAATVRAADRARSGAIQPKPPKPGSFAAKILAAAAKARSPR